MSEGQADRAAIASQLLRYHDGRGDDRSFVTVNVVVLAASVAADPVQPPAAVRRRGRRVTELSPTALLLPWASCAGRA